MRRIILAGLVIISLLTSYYTYNLEQNEMKQGDLISKEKADLDDKIKETESLIQQVEEDIAEKKMLIQEEQETQDDIRGQIEKLNAQKSELEAELKLYREIARGDPRVLITIDDPLVKEKVEEVIRLCKTRDERQQAVFEYVRKEIEYVTEGNPRRWYYPQPFLKYKFDFWQLPRETVKWRKGDCEDVSILLCTMMRMVGVPPSDVRVVLGLVRSDGGVGGHAWIEFKLGDEWYALESTCPWCNYIRKSVYYDLFNPEVWAWFNDEEYHEEESEGTEGVTESFIFTFVLT